MRLPKKFNLEGSKVLNPLESMWDNAIDDFSSDFMEERMQPETQERT